MTTSTQSTTRRCSSSPFSRAGHALQDSFLRMPTCLGLLSGHATKLALQRAGIQLPCHSQRDYTFHRLIYLIHLVMVVVIFKLQASLSMMPTACAIEMRLPPGSSLEGGALKGFHLFLISLFATSLCVGASSYHLNPSSENRKYVQPLFSYESLWINPVNRRELGSLFCLSILHLHQATHTSRLAPLRPTRHLPCMR